MMSAWVQEVYISTLPPLSAFHWTPSAVFIEAARSHPSPEEDIRVQLHLAYEAGISSIGFELTWLESSLSLRL